VEYEATEVVKFGKGTRLGQDASYENGEALGHGALLPEQALW